MRLVSANDEAATRHREADELERARRLRLVQRAGWPEVPRKDLRKLGPLLEDSRNGDLYLVARGALLEEDATAAAYFVTAAGDVVTLDRSPGAQTRAEMEQRRAERGQRRQMPRPRR